MALNTFTFGGVTSSDFGIYVSGEGLFNAPKRSAEVVSIPGRNGNFIVDKGSFENIEVTYRVFNQEKNLDDFRTKLANLRSALASKVGYQRLTDTFHPAEYRMGAFIDGVEVKPVMYNTASEFELKFNCKPQRFLTSGETAVSVTSGDTVTNPTQFDARPLLQVWGYGAITIGGKQVKIVDGAYGDIPLSEPQKITPSVVFGLTGYDFVYLDNYSLLNAGDGVLVDGESISISAKYLSNYVTDVSVTSVSNCTATAQQNGLNEWSVFIALDRVIFHKGTTETFTASCSIAADIDGNTKTYSFSFVLDFPYMSGGRTTIRYGFSATGDNAYSPVFDTVWVIPTIRGASSKNPNFVAEQIDLDIGEAWIEEDGQVLSLNSIVVLPAELPVLAPGANTITYDNTVTQLKVVPRWWKV